PQGERCRRRPPSARSTRAAKRPTTARSRTPAAAEPPDTTVPPTRRQDVTDVIHGVEVHDPYRWLEDGSSAETKAWADLQNARARDVFDALPSRARLHARLTELFAAGVSGAPRITGDLVWSLDRWGAHDQAVLVVRPLDGDSPHDPRVVVDPLAGGDATVAIDWYHPSLDGRFVAYGTSAA